MQFLYSTASVKSGGAVYKRLYKPRVSQGGLMVELSLAADHSPDNTQWEVA